MAAYIGVVGPGDADDELSLIAYEVGPSARPRRRSGALRGPRRGDGCCRSRGCLGRRYQHRPAAGRRSIRSSNRPQLCPRHWSWRAAQWPAGQRLRRLARGRRQLGDAERGRPRRPASASRWCRSPGGRSPTPRARRWWGSTRPRRRRKPSTSCCGWWLRSQTILDLTWSQISQMSPLSPRSFGSSRTKSGQWRLVATSAAQ